MLFNWQLSTWRALGLSVAVSYTAFGVLEMLRPSLAGEQLFSVKRGTSPAADQVIDLTMPLLGARDITLAAALFVFHHAKRDVEMGVLIVSGTILCAADVVVVAARKGLPTYVSACTVECLTRLTDAAAVHFSRLERPFGRQSALH
jgi:hypothetical protein